MDKKHNEINNNLMACILQTLPEGVTLNDIEVALAENMRKEERKKLVFKKFGEPIPYRKKRGENQYENRLRIDYRDYNGNWSRVSVKEGEVDKLVDILFPMVDVMSDRDATLTDTYNRFFDRRKKDETLSSQTVAYDESIWNKYYMKSDLAKMKMADIHMINIRDFFKSITGKGKITRKNFNKIKTLLNQIFDQALEDGIIVDNLSRTCPTFGLRFAIPRSKRNDVYRPEDKKILMEYLEGIEQTTYTLAVRLAFCFCMRIGELRALTWEDYDEKAGLMHIWHEIVQEKSGNVERSDMDVPHTKNRLESGERYVPVSDEAKIVLAELRKINGDKKYILNGCRGAAFSISENKFNDHLKQYCEECGIEYFSSHKIRFYGITMLYEKKVPEHIIQYIAGHSNVAMTQHYNRPDYTKKIDQDIWNSIF